MEMLTKHCQRGRWTVKVPSVDFTAGLMYTLGFICIREELIQEVLFQEVPEGVK